MPIKIKMNMSDLVGAIGANTTASIVWRGDKILIASGNKEREFEYVAIPADKKMYAGLKITYSPTPHYIDDKTREVLPFSCDDITNLKKWQKQRYTKFTASVGDSPGDRYRWSVK